MRHIRLFWLIFPASLFISILSISLISWFTLHDGKRFFTDHLVNDLEQRAIMVEDQVTELSNTSPEILQEYIRVTGRKSSVRMTVIDRQGKVIADSHEDIHNMDNHANRPEIKEAFAGKTGSSIRFSHTLDVNMLYVTLPITLYTPSQHGVLRLSVTTASFDTITSSFIRKALFLALAVILLAGVLSFYCARYISRPLESMKQHAENMTRGDSPSREEFFHDTMSEEMAALAKALKAMESNINLRIHTIEQQRNELEAVFASMSEAVIAVDAERRIININDSAATLFQVEREKVKGEIINGSIRVRELHDLIAGILKKHQALEQEITIFDGQKAINLDVHGVPLKSPGRDSLGVLVVINDQTELNRLENIRQDFVANVSHELKTPITAIKGYVETLLEGALDDKEYAIRFLHIVGTQATRLDNIIDDLLTLSRIENSNNNEISLQQHSIFATLEAALQPCGVYADAKDVSIQVDCEDDLEARINSPLMEQAIINLVKNAISASPEGGMITLRAYSGKDIKEKHYVYLSITDQGQGITEEHLPRLFERFYRCDKARNREQGGTGLGLAIVKHIAQSHGGEINVTSTVGQGSTFTISIPL